MLPKGTQRGWPCAVLTWRRALAGDWNAHLSSRTRPGRRGPRSALGACSTGQQTPAVQRPQHLLQGLPDTDKGLGLLSQLWGPRTRREISDGKPKVQPLSGRPLG